MHKKFILGFVLFALALLAGIGWYSNHVVAQYPVYERLEAQTAHDKAERCIEAQGAHEDAEDQFAREHHRAPMPREEAVMQRREDEACQ